MYILDIANNLNISESDDLKNYLDLLSGEIMDWRKYVKFNRYKYNKIDIYRNNIFEIVLIVWLPGQKTKFHKHPKNGCIMKLLYGELHEIKNKDKNFIQTLYKEGNIAYMHDTLGTHLISNISKKPAISLHIYSPPNFYS